VKIYRDLVQGTSEWNYTRAGIPTSSQFERIMTPSGKVSKQAEMYLYQLLAERMMKHPVVEFHSHWMDRGSQMEAEAVNFYQFTRDVSTEKIGFITNDAGTIGASPDRLVGTDGLLEIKVPKESTHVAFLMQSGSAYDEYKTQTQGQLWIAEREWNDLVSYHAEMPEAIIRIERDEPFIRMLSDAVTTFSLELERQFQICFSRGWCDSDWRRESPHRAPVATEDFSQRELIGALKDSLRELKVQP
jgi:hypothetical protein